MPLTRDFLKTWGDSWWSSAPRELLALYESGLRTRNRHEVVLLQKVLAGRVNQGYHDCENLVVEAVDGKTVKSLAHLVKLVEADREGGGYITLGGNDGTRIVLDREQVEKSGKRLLRKFGVPADRSCDLRATTET